MDRLLAVGVVKLSDDAIKAMQENYIKSLRELMIKRDLGLLDSKHFDSRVLQELLEACEKIDDFNEGIEKEIMPSRNDNYKKLKRKVSLHVSNESNIDGRLLVREGILKDLFSISNLEVPTSLRKAVLKLMLDYPYKEFDRKMIKKNLGGKYKNAASVNSDSLRCTLSSLESHMFIRRSSESGFYKITKYAMDEFLKCPNAKNYYSESSKIKYLKDKEISTFISNNIGREIEFRYKTERVGSDKRWRRVRVYDQDDVYMYTVNYYQSGGRIRYLKEKIIEYREI